jgi:hypothetical protein
MARCQRGVALCIAVADIRAEQAIYTEHRQIRTGRPKEQLDHIRRLLAEHDAHCIDCGLIRQRDD